MTNEAELISKLNGYTQLLEGYQRCQVRTDAEFHEFWELRSSVYEALKAGGGLRNSGQVVWRMFDGSTPGSASVTRSLQMARGDPGGTIIYLHNLVVFIFS